METIRIEDKLFNTVIVYINTSQVMSTVKYKYKTSKVLKRMIMINVPILSLLYDIPPVFFLYHKGHIIQDDTH